MNGKNEVIEFVVDVSEFRDKVVARDCGRQHIDTADMLSAIRVLNKITKRDVRLGALVDDGTIDGAPLAAADAPIYRVDADSSIGRRGLG